MADDEKIEREIGDAQAELRKLRADFEGATTPLQRAMARLRHHLGSPAVTVVTLAGIAAWVGWNLTLGRRALDPSPYPVLNTVVSTAALLATVLILAGQRREDEAARRVARLTLQLSAESEQKIAKLIALVEEQRRDSPHMPDRHDPEAERMSAPAQPRALVEQVERDDAG